MTFTQNFSKEIVINIYGNIFISFVDEENIGRIWDLMEIKFEGGARGVIGCAGKEGLTLGNMLP